MRAFVKHQGIAAPLTEAGVLRRNIDTDAIIPSREMKQVSKTSLVQGLFANWRYLSPDSREPNPDFVLNQGAFSRASLLIAGENFGCGSSREQAVWGACRIWHQSHNRPKLRRDICAQLCCQWSLDSRVGSPNCAENR